MQKAFSEINVKFIKL